jgi:hypothetical protein
MLLRDFNVRNKYTFQKGHHIGRKKGSKAKVYLSLDYWFRHLNAEFMNLTPHQRAKISLEAFKALLAKTNSLPQDPSESLPNSNNLAELVKQLESSTETSKDKLNLTMLSEINVNNVKDCKDIHPYDIPKSGSSEEAKAVLESQSNNDCPQTKIEGEK